MKNIFLVLAITVYSVSVAQPTISFTFDDGRPYDQGGYSANEWNEMILESLAKQGIKGAFFVRTRGMNGLKGKKIIESWDNQGHIIANHTHTHPNFNKEENTTKVFENELLKADSILSQYDNFTKLFRFPYLKEGGSIGKVDSIRQILQKQGYKNGYITIDNSEWYIDGKLNKAYKNNSTINLEAFKRIYLDHMLERAMYYEKISFDLTGRHISHTMLLHHNLASALFLDDLIEMFLSKGWKILSAEEAFKDPIFQQLPQHTGSSLIWDLAKDSGNYDEELGDAIKSEMERVGL
jgi:peptidoglycan/xylan/chitin deacetylase (PgdA/CDA1 family)